MTSLAHAPPDAGVVRVRDDGVVVRLVLDRPPVNVLDAAALDDLLGAVVWARARAPRIVVLSGAGRSFCAGVDVADHTAERIANALPRFHDVIRGLLALPCPVVAVVHGAVLGGGCELALACDIVLARGDARLGQPEIRLGVFPPVAAVLLPQRIGRARAIELILTGRTLTAEEALAYGLVTAVWPTEQFGVESERYVNALASCSAPALRFAKRAVLETESLPTEQGIALAEALYLRDLMAGTDAREGVAAFLAKREPVWTEV